MLACFFCQCCFATRISAAGLVNSMHSWALEICQRVGASAATEIAIAEKLLMDSVVQLRICASDGLNSPVQPAASEWTRRQ